MFRGQPDLYGASYQPGERVLWQSFTSVSTDRCVAERFAAHSAQGSTGPAMLIVDGLPAYATANLQQANARLGSNATIGTVMVDQEGWGTWDPQKITAYK